MAEYTRPEAKAGLIIVVAVLLLSGLLVFISDYSRFMQPKREVLVVFQDTQGLKVKDPVRYAGVNAGRISGLRVADTADLHPVGPAKKDPYRGPLTARKAVVVSFQLPKTYEVRTDDVLLINRTLTGGLTLEVQPVGEGKPWEPGAPPIRGTEYPGLSEYARRGGELLDAAEASLSAMRKRGTQFMDSAEELVAGIKSVFTEQEQKEVRSLIRNLDEGSAQLAQTAKRINEILAAEGEGTHVLADAGKIVAELQQFLAETRKDVVDTLKHLRTASDSFPAISAEAEQFVGRLNTLLDRSRDPISEAAGNFKATSENLLGWSEDVRRQPWLLLRKPDEAEVSSREISYAARQLREGLAEADRSVEKVLNAYRDQKLSEEQTRQIVDDLKQIVGRVRILQQRLEKQAK